MALRPASLLEKIFLTLIFVYVVTLIGFAVAIVLSEKASGQTTGSSAIHNTFQQDRTTVYNPNGTTNSDIRENTFDHDRYDVYNSDGDHTQTIRKNTFQRDRYDTYDDSDSD